LIDPTFKERNALAGLSYETFSKFQEACKEFLKNPSERFFEKREVDKKKYNLILKAKTNKQEGDIAGSKLYKFYKLIAREMKKNFIVEKEEFEYDDKKEAKLYFKIKQKKELVLKGPHITSIENVAKFRKKHKRVFIKDSRVYAKEKSKNIKKFLSDFKKDNKRRMRDMGIIGLKVSQLENL
jgi:tRNA nucleotidyltransferase (CCA-adding enzyme)